MTSLVLLTSSRLGFTGCGGPLLAAVGGTSLSEGISGRENGRCFDMGSLIVDEDDEDSEEEDEAEKGRRGSDRMTRKIGITGTECGASCSGKNSFVIVVGADERG